MREFVSLKEVGKARKKLQIRATDSIGHLESEEVEVRQK